MTIKRINTTTIDSAVTTWTVASFEPPSELDEVAELYEQYYRASIAQPFDEAACMDAYLAWKGKMEQLGLGYPRA